MTSINKSCDMNEIKLPLILSKSHLILKAGSLYLFALMSLNAHYISIEYIVGSGQVSKTFFCVTYKRI